ncbi:MAG: transposase [Stenomitos frigidus ULC029]
MGEHCFYEFTHLNSDCFQVFLNLVSERYKDSIVIMQVDQAGAHKAKRLKLPVNIILLFQPSHAPETNPIERVWKPFKLGLRWQLPKHLDEWRLLIRSRLEAMTQAVMASLVGWHSILEALSVAGL